MDEFEMFPSELRFAQGTIKSTFTRGDKVHDVIDDIIAGHISLNDFSTIQAAFFNGRWYVENNRTLYVCRVLEYMGQVTKIPVKEVKTGVVSRNWSTKNEGESITIREGEMTRPHSVQDIENRRQHTVARSAHVPLNSARTASYSANRGDSFGHTTTPSYSAREDNSGWGGILALGAGLAAAGVAAYMASDTKKLPSELRFSQSSINNTFTNGDRVHDVTDDIISGRKSIEEFLPIQVEHKNGQWFVENNRTLYVCRVLECMGRIGKITVNQVSGADWRRTTTNDGMSVTMRGEATRPHSVQEINSQHKNGQDECIIQ